MSLFTLADNGSDNVIDSRDIIERIEDLESREDYPEDEEDSLDAEEREELCILREIQDNASSEWFYGETLIHENYFVDYIREFVQEVGYLPDNMPEWLTNNLDWDGIANDLQSDYRDVDLNGETYWVL